MADASKPILSEAEIGLITAIVQAVPAVGAWIGGLFDGDDVDPNATRRVRDVLPEKSASAQAAEDLK